MTKAGNNAKFGSFLGLCARAGKLRSGEFAAEALIKENKARLVILADDASEGTAKHFRDMCEYRDIRLITAKLGKDELGHVIGRDERSVIAVTDSGFAERILLIAEGGNACG